MAGAELRILLVEDNPGDARLIEEMLRDRRVESPVAEEGILGGAESTRPVDTTLLHERRLADGLRRLDDGAVDVVLLDLGLSDSTGLETLTRALERAQSVPVVVLTGLDDERVGVRAVQQGAQSYLRKDELSGELLLRSIRHALERHERERQLTALTTLSEDLQTATSTEELADLAVSAAAAVLGFSVAIVCLYDSDQGKLRPAAATDAATPLLRSGDDAESDGQIVPALSETCRAAVETAFTTNEPSVDAADDDGSAVADAESPLRSRLVLPLGPHGVLLLGSTTRATVSSSSVDFATMLATNAQATLERLARERKLRERETTLERQTESLERLNRINAVIRDVVQGVVHATTRAEIEQAVCDRLATAGPYRFVWIGSHDPLGRTIAPRASAGVEDGFLDSVTFTTGDAATEADPVGLAVQSRESQVVADAVTQSSRNSWRAAALKRGYRSVASFPLEYSETLYGVLTVYGEQPGLFGDEEVNVLSELADTIAHAINAAESKRALISDRVVELEFDVRDQRLAFVELSDAADCTFEFESVVPRGDDRLRVFFTTRGAAVEAVTSFAEQALVFEELSLVSERESGCVFEGTLREPNLVSFCLDRGVFVQSLTADDGEGRAVFELANDAGVREFAEQFQSTYPETDLLASREHERSVQTRQSFQSALDDLLTARQAEVLRTAFFSGYFESPRTSSGRQLAEKLGISQPTMNQHLRSALRKLMTLLYAD